MWEFSLTENKIAWFWLTFISECWEIFLIKMIVIILHDFVEVSMWWFFCFNQVAVVPADPKEKLWQEFFSDPSQWWDYRLEKVSEYACCCILLADG
jgi:hypothetical protein